MQKLPALLLALFFCKADLLVPLTVVGYGLGNLSLGKRTKAPHGFGWMGRGRAPWLGTVPARFLEKFQWLLRVTNPSSMIAV